MVFDDKFVLGVMFVLSVILPTVIIFLETQKRPSNATLATVDIGTVCQFDYRQPLTGEVRRCNVTVVGRSKIDPGWTRATNRKSNYRKYDKDFKRTQTLLMCVTNDGFRQFYAERASNVRVMHIRTLYNRVRRAFA